MKRVAAGSVVGSLLLSCAAPVAFGQARENNGAVHAAGVQPPTTRIIVKWRDGTAATAVAASVRTQKLGASAAVRLTRKHQIALETDVLELDRALGANDARVLLGRIVADPNVEYAVADERRWPHVVPTDPLYPDQWYFQSIEIAATRAEQAWDATVGSNTTVVAVLDTGVRFDHPDLLRLAQAGKLLDGFDFVSQATFSNDGSGRDADPSDPGDFVTSAETSQPGFTNCEVRNSSWHGTRVASLIGGLTNNAEGLAGTGWNTLILPVRVLAKCGGIDSDIIMGMRWAAGLPVVGLPVNPTPAHIINLSLGGGGVCSAAYQAAVDEITASGVLIVASVGNEGGPVAAPANCNGVLGVTGIRHAGTKVGFSNLGPGAGIGAPGGNCVNLQITPSTPCLFPITAATNTGTTTPGASAYTDRVVNINVGTSFAAPLVAGAAALMHSLNSQLTPAQYISLLKDSATPFPTSSPSPGPIPVCHVPAGDVQTEECICTTDTCGAGMLNTRAAILAAQRPFASVIAPDTINTGTAVSIDGRASFASNGRTITTHRWSAVGVTGAQPTFADASQPLTTLQVAAASTFTLRLTVTDDQGTQDTADVAIVAATPPPPPPPPTPPTPPPSGGGGGGGSVSWMLIALLIVTSVLRRDRRGIR